MSFSNGMAAVSVAALFMCGIAHAAPLPATQREALEGCTARAAAETGFNGTVQLSRLGEIIASKNFGASDAAGKIPITDATRFNIASASKMFTGVSIGLLVERGAVEFDAPIGRYLPGLDPAFAAITVRQLLQHTSGLGDFFSPSTVAAINSAKSATDLLPLALASPPAFAPGSKVAYSNSGYMVLGAIIESVAHMPYAAFVQKEILSPLGMNGTSLTSEGSADPMTHMTLEGMSPSLQVAAPRSTRASPAGGMWSTASDMSRFLAALADHRLLKAATLAALFRPRPHSPARIGHNGGTPGANAEVWFYPDSGWQVIVLSNYDPPGATRVATILEQAMLAKDTAAACATAIAAPPPEMPGLVIRRPQ